MAIEDEHKNIDDENADIDAHGAQLQRASTLVRELSLLVKEKPGNGKSLPQEVKTQLTLRQLALISPDRNDSEPLKTMVFNPTDAAVLRGERAMIKEADGSRREAYFTLEPETAAERADNELVRSTTLPLAMAIGRMVVAEPMVALRMGIGRTENQEIADVLLAVHTPPHPFRDIWRQFLDLRNDLYEANKGQTEIKTDAEGRPVLDRETGHPKRERLKDDESLLRSGVRPPDWEVKVRALAAALDDPDTREVICHSIAAGEFRLETNHIAVWLLKDPTFEQCLNEVEATAAREGRPTPMDEIVSSATEAMGISQFTPTVTRSRTYAGNPGPAGHGLT